MKTVSVNADIEDRIEIKQDEHPLVETSKSLYKIPVNTVKNSRGGLNITLVDFRHLNHLVYQDPAETRILPENNDSLLSGSFTSGESQPETHIHNRDDNSAKRYDPGNEFRHSRHFSYFPGFDDLLYSHDIDGILFICHPETEILFETS